MSHEAKFKQGDLIVNEYGDTAVVVYAEPDDAGRVIINRAENPDSEKAWVSVYQGFWTKVPQYPVRWLVFDRDGAVVAFTLLESARHYATDNTRGILHVCKDGTTEWIDIEEEG